MMKINKNTVIERYLATDENVRRIIHNESNLKWDNKKKWNVIIDGRGYNIKTIFCKPLLEVTKNHCAFCDFYPLDVYEGIPFEHFEPKCISPDKGYSWSNLYPVCQQCTALKGNDFNNKLLKPDEDSYEFESYFTIEEGRIECKDKLKESRATITIDIYNLNRGYLVKERKKHIKIFSALKVCNNEIDEYPFRFLILIANRYQSPDDIINSYIQ